MRRRRQSPANAMCRRVNEREISVALSATETLGALPEDARFWHIYNYPTRLAAQAVKAPRGTVVEAFGKVWLYAIAASTWKPAGGQRIAVVGPLPIAAGTNYTARYMEAVFPAKMSTPVHVHSGAQAWYVCAVRNVWRRQTASRSYGRVRAVSYLRGHQCACPAWVRHAPLGVAGTS